MASLRVMLIEDDEVTRSTVKAALEKKGIEIIFDTPSVAEALTLLRSIGHKLLSLTITSVKVPMALTLQMG